MQFLQILKAVVRGTALSVGENREIPRGRGDEQLQVSNAYPHSGNYTISTSFITAFANTLTRVSGERSFVAGNLYTL